MQRQRRRAFGVSRSRGVTLTGAATLLGAETQGLAIDFTDLSMSIIDTGTPANTFAGNPNSKLTYSSPSTKWVLGSDGLYSSGTTLRTSYNSSGTALGVLIEEARTNLCLQSNDLTNASWTKSNLTTAKTATGPDGAANSATTITASAGNATALQAITSGSAARITSVFLKRRTGTGNVDVTQDNGSTWATRVITTSWARYEIASVTSTNPTVGIRLVTSGDAVDVAYFQHEVGAFVTSPIVTTAATATRAADDVSILTTAFPYLTSVGTNYAKYSALAYTIGPNAVSGIDGNGRWNYINSGNGQHQIYDGATILASGNAGSLGVFQKAASAVGSGTMSISGNGAAAASAAFDNTMGTGSLYVGSGNYTSSYLNGYVQQFMHLPRKMTNSELVVVTT